MSERILKKITSSTWFQNFPRYAGAAVLLLGLLIITSWYAHWQAILQMLPHTAPMQYNSALCFILTGAGLFLLTTSQARFAPRLGGVVAAFTLLTLLEYLTKTDFHIDQIFFQPYFEADTIYPGRMSPLTAVCFILIGSGTFAVGRKKSWTHRLTIGGLLACIVIIIAAVALFGFAIGIQSAYGWGSYSRMAVNNAAAFFALGSGLLIWSWQMSRQDNFNFLRWLPVTSSVTLMVMIAFVSAVNMAELKTASFWRKHTVDVILKTHAFQDNLTALQLGVNSYVATGDTNALASYQNRLQLEPQQLDQLTRLTHDNPVQQNQLKALAAAMDDVLFHDRLMISLYDQQRFGAVSKTDTETQSHRVFARALAAVNLVSSEEQRLLDVRDNAEQADYHNAACLLVLGSVLAAVFLVLANQMASRELRQRRQIEIEREKLIHELRQALADVKILSGMIPICGWCKSVRTDEGYWQSVEQYVRSNTDATFSHGVCPNCSEKFKAEILRANSPRAA